MVRFENWPSLLSKFLSEQKLKEFEWGINDCVMFGGKAVEALTGRNYYQEYVGYTTEEEALEIIAKNDGIQNLISKHLGTPSNKILKASRGDLALLRMPYFVCGVVDDSGQFVAAMTDKGYVRRPLRHASCIWSY